MQKEHAAAPDYIFLCLAGIITVFGFIALASASSIFSYESFGSSFYLIRHQLLFGFLPGLLAFFVAMRMHYTKWKKLSGLIFIATVVMVALVLIPGIGNKLGGSRSWFSIGSFSFQPSELAKLGLILYLALWFEARQDRLQDFYYYRLLCHLFVLLFQPAELFLPATGSFWLHHAEHVPGEVLQSHLPPFP